MPSLELLRGVVSAGETELVEALLAYGPAVDAKDNDGCTPLLLAAEGGKKGLAAANGLAFAHGMGL
jgi:hypothetical protein